MNNRYAAPATAAPHRRCAWAAMVACLSVLFLATGCADLFQQKVPMTGHSSGALADLLLDEEVITKLDVPSQVFVSKNLFSNQIMLSWSSVPNAASYRLERAVVETTGQDGTYPVPPEEDFTVLQAFVYGTSYTDILLDDPVYSSPEYGYAYFYRISAENSREKYDSSEYADPQYGTLFAPPSSVQAELGKETDSIRVSWSAVDGASFYDIYRSTSPNGTGSDKIGTVTANLNTYKNTVSSEEQGINFYYTVRARNSSGHESVVSSVAMGYALCAGAPAQVENVAVVAGAGRGDSVSEIKITWDPVMAISEVKYAVYRTSASDSSLTLLTAGVTDTSYTDSVALKQHERYYYLVQSWILDAETGAKITGAVSDSGASSENPAEGFILSPPASVSASKDETYQYVRWAAAIGSEQEQESYTYTVYGDLASSGSFTQAIDTVTATSLTADEEGYYEIRVSSPTNFYKIKTVNAAGVESAFSAIAAAAPYAAESIVASQHAKIDGWTDAAVENVNSSGVYPVQIEWSAPAGDESVAGYLVYRSTKKDSGFRCLTESPIAETSYLDVNDSAKAGKIYYYRVLSVNSLGQGKNYSGTADGWGALTAEQYMREYNTTVKSSQKKLTLMHKSNDLDKLGSESVSGGLCGSLSYEAKTDGLGARIVMYYENYADYYADSNPDAGYYFLITGNTNTKASMDASGTMDGTVVCLGMYPGKVYYDNIKIKGGGAGGGTYGIEQDGFERTEISYLVGEE